MRECVNETEQAAHRAAALTRQLLVFARREVATPELLDLTQVVVGLEKMLRRVIAENIDLRLETAKNQVNVFADATQLEQVIVNLVINARDAMSQGGVLTVRTELIEAGGLEPHEADDTPGESFAVIEVRDTGSGMDEITLERAFEPFFTTKAAGLGTGLGLATVYGIVEDAGGRITVESELGRGSTFRVFLPAANESATRIRPSTRTAPRALATRRFSFVKTRT